MSQKNMQALLASRPHGWVQESDFRVVESDLPVLQGCLASKRWAPRPSLVACSSLAFCR